MRRADDFQAVAQPLNRGSADEDAPLERISYLLPYLPCDRSQHPVFGKNRPVAGIHHHEATRSVGRLGHALLDAKLSEKSGLLVAGNARNGYLRRKERRGRIAVNFAAGLYFGQNRPGNTEQIEQIVVPLLRVDIEEHRTRRVRHVGHMRPTPRKPPDQPAVDRSEAELALLRALAHALDVIKNPLDLVAEK